MANLSKLCELCQQQGSRRHLLVKGVTFILGHYCALLVSKPGSAQRLIEGNIEDSCNYDGSEDPNVDRYAFSSSQEAVEMVNTIVSQIGIVQNFIVEAANVLNAKAHVSDYKRYIYYSEDFMRKLAADMPGNWPSLTILAHEVGHHIQGHTLKPGPGRPEMELEADRFSGFIVARLGGSVDDATQTLVAASEFGSATHPPRSARIEAVINGWNSAPKNASKGRYLYLVNRCNETVSVALRYRDLSGNWITRSWFVVNAGISTYPTHQHVRLVTDNSTVYYVAYSKHWRWAGRDGNTDDRKYWIEGKVHHFRRYRVQIDSDGDFVLPINCGGG